MDIIGGSGEIVGYLARGVEEYAQSLATAVNTANSSFHKKMLQSARKRVEKFTEQQFERIFISKLAEVSR